MKLGTPKAITAAAHKLARIVYHLITTQQSYDETIFLTCEEQHQARVEARIRRQASNLGFDLVQRPQQT